jgi:hypothetical protein
MRTVDLKENENASDLHVNLIRSCVKEYEQLNDTTLFEVFHFKDWLIPWIFSKYKVKYNVFIDDDGDDAICSVTITDEKQYAWYLLKHTTCEVL